MSKSTLINNSDKVNTEFTLFKKVDKVFIESPNTNSKIIKNKKLPKVKTIDEITTNNLTSDSNSIDEVYEVDEIKVPVTNEAIVMTMIKTIQKDKSYTSSNLTSDTITIEPQIMDEWDRQTYKNELERLQSKMEEVNKLNILEEKLDEEIIPKEDRKYINPSFKYNSEITGKGKKSARSIQNYLSVKLGTDGRKLLDRIIEQALYTYDSSIDTSGPRYTDETIRFSQKILMDFGYPKPAHKEEKLVEVSIEHKLDDALRMIHENRQKVKLLN